ncbi:MAG: GMC family oxidoreductase [Candidatus Eisenbacteria bacterium]
MSARRVAIVGSGMMGSTLAYELTRAGLEVTVFEKGPDFPYPHRERFVETVEYGYDDPARSIAPDLRRMTNDGSYARELQRESVLRLGGAGTAWTGLATRMSPNDHLTKSRYGFGMDWPLSYAELEPWLCRAEAQLGVSGTDADNPWAPWRSRPYPLPPFELTPDDAWLAARLEAAGIRVHSTPQARTRAAYEGRPACMNVGECQVCPNGARYSSTHHLRLAMATGRCRVRTDATVRRVVTDATGRARGVAWCANGDGREREHAADLVIVAGAAFESARLLLLSRDAKHPDGLGNTHGHVGRHLVFHHIWIGHLHVHDALFAGRVGFWTAQSDQFVDPPGRGKHGGVKIELPSKPSLTHVRDAANAGSLADALRAFEVVKHCRQVGMHAESDTTGAKFVALSKDKDRYGDPVAHVHYDSSDFDRATYAYARTLFDRVADAAGAHERFFPELEGFGAFAHYMGTHRMSRDPKDGVVDTFGAVHDTPGLYAIGLGMFVGSGGAVTPTLTGVALAIRAADAIARGARA